ncbi:MAG: hypothetical protein AABY27_05890 [Pseudomonadota bacterium]
MIRIRYQLTIILLGLCVFGLFQVKFKVQNLNKEMSELQKQLEHEKNSIYVLKAEWTYLNQPERLQRLSEKHLKLAEIKVEQIMFAEPGDIIVARNSKAPNIIQENKNLIKTSMNIPPYKANSTKWRYRERPAILARRKK